MVSFFQNSWLALLLTAVTAYLLGSTNWAIIITRLFAHQDIRQVGSGNAGATNVLRSQGLGLALLTLLGDVGKGVVAALLGGFILSHVQLAPGEDPMLTRDVLEFMGPYVAGLFCVIGHLHPIFHGFRGGKGVAATMGILFVMDWRMALMCLGLFLITVALSRMVSLGSVLAMSYVPVLTFMFRRWADDMSMEAVVFCTVLSGVVGLIVIFKHGANMRRIADGTESRIGDSAKEKTVTNQQEEN